MGMRRISMRTRDELVAAVSERYGRASRAECGRILDEFTAVAGLHRKHAVCLLRGGTPRGHSVGCYENNGNCSPRLRDGVAD